MEALLAVLAAPRYLALLAAFLLWRHPGQWACILPASSRFLLCIPSICSSICSQSGRGCGGRGGSGGDSTSDFRPSCLPCCSSSSRILAPHICSLLLLAPSFLWRTARSSFASLDFAIQQNFRLPTFMPSLLHLFPLVFTPFPGSPPTLHPVAALTLAAAALTLAVAALMRAAAASRPRSILGFSALPPS